MAKSTASFNPGVAAFWAKINRMQDKAYLSSWRLLTGWDKAAKRYEILLREHTVR